MSKEERIELAQKRLRSVIGTHGIALSRTIEHKIADGGPYNQRLNPHVITDARRTLQDRGIIIPLKQNGITWYHLEGEHADTLSKRLDEQEPVHMETMRQKFTTRVGQALEIAVEKALKTSDFQYFGKFRELDRHGDELAYIKEEPPSHFGANELPNKQRLDFLLIPENSKLSVGLEVKNIRAWLYPNQSEIQELIYKCVVLNVIPVLIGRRIPFVTRNVFGKCGLIIWETLRQRYPNSEHHLAGLVRHKKSLGYSDVTLGNEPDTQLLAFVQDRLPPLLPEARDRFDCHFDLLTAFAVEGMSYTEFAARVRRRHLGQNEDFDDEKRQTNFDDPPF